MSNLKRGFFGIGFLVMALILFGCATPSKQAQVLVGMGDEVSIKAWNFAFDPSIIRMHSPGSLTLRVDNTSETMHNISVDDPQGNKIVSADLPPHQIVTVNLRLPTAGIYKMYCDKTFHATMGMKGQIEVGQ